MLKKIASKVIVDYNYLRLGIAIMLVVSSILKMTFPTWESYSLFGFTMNRDSRFVLIYLELIFGVWVLIGFFQVLTKIMIVGVFSLFAAVNFDLINQNDQGCHCFGRFISVDPRVMFSFDFLIVCCVLFSFFLNFVFDNRVEGIASNNSDVV